MAQSEHMCDAIGSIYDRPIHWFPVLLFAP